MVLEYSELGVCVGQEEGVVLEYSELSVCVGRRRGWSWSTVSPVCVGRRRGWSWCTVSAVCVLTGGGGGPGVQ